MRLALENDGLLLETGDHAVGETLLDQNVLPRAIYVFFSMPMTTSSLQMVIGEKKEFPVCKVRYINSA